MRRDRVAGSVVKRVRKKYLIRLIGSMFNCYLLSRFDLFVTINVAVVSTIPLLLILLFTPLLCNAIKTFHSLFTPFGTPFILCNLLLDLGIQTSSSCAQLIRLPSIAWFLSQALPHIFLTQRTYSPTCYREHHISFAKRN